MRFPGFGLLGCFLLLLAPVLGCHAANSAPLKNQLASHASPYLAQHGQDPVAWQEWNVETLARARRENKLLFVSVGYFSCHWCHVMQRESYRDPVIAALLNKHFIPVKVDRELNGALDAALIEFAERMSGVGGWPLNVFVTPEGFPAYALLYAPPADFRRLLTRIDQTWRNQQTKFRQAAIEAGAIVPAVPVGSPPKIPANAAQQLQQAFMQSVWQYADTLQGGFDRVSKFPMPAHLAALLNNLALNVQANKPEPKLAEFLQLTLDQMAQRGLRDHVNGGFFRYTVDPDWATPHFEKMLYDNAQLAVLYAQAARVLHRPDYLIIAHETLDWLLTALQAPSGGFYTATSAVDAQGREGGNYLWRTAELQRVLSAAEFSVIHTAWRLDQPAPYDLGYLPVRASATQEASHLLAILKKLKGLGKAKAVPRDDKINAGLNGLALSALSLAGQGVPRFEQAAHALHGFIDKQMQVRGTLLKTRAGAGRTARQFADAELDDYAYVAAGLADYARVFKRPEAERLARRWVQKAWQQFFSAAGWLREARPLLATMRPQAAIEDGALPSASLRLMATTLSLGPEKAQTQHLRQAMALTVLAMRKRPFDYPSALNVLRVPSSEM